jgi:hypothetical protein
VRSVQRLRKVWQLEASSAQKLQLGGASKQGQELLDMEAATKQSSEDRDPEHQSVCYSDL